MGSAVPHGGWEPVLGGAFDYKKVREKGVCSKGWIGKRGFGGGENTSRGKKSFGGEPIHRRGEVLKNTLYRGKPNIVVLWRDGWGARVNHKLRAGGRNQKKPEKPGGF